MTNDVTQTALSTPQRVLLMVIALASLALNTWGVYAILTKPRPIVVWDFHPPWTGLRALLREGRDPYSPAVSAVIQEQMLGHTASPGEDQFAFVYPLYILAIIGPLVFLPLPAAQAIWFVLIEASLLTVILLAPRAVGWKTPSWLLAITVVFVLGLYSTIWAVVLGQISILVAAFVTLGWWGVRTERWALAGAFLALSTLKPQMVFLFVPGVLLWAAYRRHWRLVASFTVALAVLILLPMFWQLTWPLAWLNAMRRYTDYTIYEPPLVALLPATWLAIGISMLLLAWTVYCWWRAPQRQGAAFDWALSMLLVIGALIAPRTSHVNQLALLLPLFFIFGRMARPGLIVAIELALLAGPWALDLLLPPPINGLEHMIWQHHVINPILPMGLVLALLVLSPRPVRGGVR